MYFSRPYLGACVLICAKQKCTQVLYMYMTCICSHIRHSDTLHLEFLCVEITLYIQYFCVQRIQVTVDRKSNQVLVQFPIWRCQFPALELDSAAHELTVYMNIHQHDHVMSSEHTQSSIYMYLECWEVDFVLLIFRSVKILYINTQYVVI